jgi:aspartyl aminopeptidase
VKYQNFFNRSDVRSGSTLGVIAAKALGVSCADIGIAQLAMHSACESFAQSDYIEFVNGLTAFYSSNFLADEGGFIVR